MKDYHFYLEYPTNKDKRQGTRKSLGNHCGTVLAVDTNPFHSWVTDKEIIYESVGSIYGLPDSYVCSSACSWGYLREKCKRISEDQARQIHPKLFNYLEQ
jgi:hypothetical protein